MSLRKIPLSNPEQASSVANGILADRLIQRICVPGGTFLDVGAHIGSVLASVHSFNKKVDICAFEADPSKAQILRKKFPFCRLFEVAVGESEGRAEFFLNPKASGYNSLVSQSAADQPTITVRVAALDDLLPDGQVDVIKIDIEGAELGALRGGENLIRRNKPTIMFESVGTGINSLGYSPALLWEWFNDMEYAIFTPDRLAHNAPSLGLEAFLDAHEYPFRTHNYFAVSRDRRTEIRDRAREIIGVRPSR